MFTLFSFAHSAAECSALKCHAILLAYWISSGVSVMITATFKKTMKIGCQDKLVNKVSNLCIPAPIPLGLPR